MKDIGNAKLKSFSCCFRFPGHVHELSYTESRALHIFQIFLNKIPAFLIVYLTFTPVSIFFDSKY